MQEQDTSSSPTGQDSSIGHFVVTLILHGAAAAVEGAFHAIRGILPGHDVELAHATTEGPLSPADDRTHLPIIAPFVPPAATEPAPVVNPPAVVVPPPVVTMGQLQSALTSARSIFDTLESLAHDGGPEVELIVHEVVKEIVTEMLGAPVEADAPPAPVAAPDPVPVAPVEAIRPR